MKSIFFSIIILISLSSCQEKKPGFINLEKHAGEGFFDRGNNIGKKFIYKSVLVENAPDSDKEILKMLIDYKNQNLNNIDKKEDFYSLTVFFYFKNNATSYFIDNADDPGGLTSEVLQDKYQKDGLGEINIDRCEDDKEKWTSKISYFDMQRNTKDTILNHCEIDTK